MQLATRHSTCTQRHPIRTKTCARLRGRTPAVAARPVAAEDRVAVLARARIPAGTRAETDAVMVVFIVDVQSDGTGPAVVRASRMGVSG